MLDGGTFTAAAGIWRRDDDMNRRVRFPIPAYLIETGDERTLVDAGLHPDAVTDRVDRYGSLDALGPVEVELERSVAHQLDATTITKVVLSHLHYDHAGGLALLPHSVPIFIQRREWEAGQDAGAIAKNFFHPVDYASIGGRVKLVDGDHDCSATGRSSCYWPRGTHPATSRCESGTGW